MQHDWDIFCRVIDNFGDIGVCWRLARQLTHEHHQTVRLWVDDLQALHLLLPALDPGLLSQHCNGVEVCRWPKDFPDTQPAINVIEAFACDLPATYLAAMANREPAPCWFNLEYLTAEPWAEAWHGMVSPHPALPLCKKFFFPGFSNKSGGLLRESQLIEQREMFQSRLSKKDKVQISLFCYDNAPVGQLLDTIAQGKTAVRCFVPPGKPAIAVSRHVGSGQAQTIGQLELKPISFLTQIEFDRLLWQCDINFVRGEDSFVRAQWAAQPFVWQIYPQEENAHWKKLEAFTALYGAGFDGKRIRVMQQMFNAWNSGLGVDAAWQAFSENLAEQRDMARKWSKKLSDQPDLASRLVNLSNKPV